MENNIFLNNYGRLYNPPNWFYNPNYLINRIYYIVSGTAYFKDDILLKPGHLYFFKASPEFKVSQDEKDPVDHIFFDFLSSIQLADEEYVEIALDAVPKLKGIIETLTEDYSINDNPTEIAKSYVQIIIYELQKHLKIDKVYTDLTTKCLWYIHANDPAEVSVNTIAESLNININHLIRTFKKDTGVTPLKYISLMKSELAITYLHQGHSLEYIAGLLGYSTVSALSVFFKNTTGRNLSEFRFKST